MRDAKQQSELAVLSCDLDPVDCHLVGYGVNDAPPCDVIYRRAVPRLLDLLDEMGLRAVFFFVARDARHQQPLLREIRSRGHEVASHSLTHPQPFHGLDDEALRREVGLSRQLLGDVLGTAIDGFRAPAWDVDERVLAAVAAAGYLYDASMFPSPILSLGRLVAEWRGSAHGPIADMKSSYAWAPLQPHGVGEHGAELVEFPIGVTRRLRFPAYHTMTHLMPWPAFRMILAAALRGLHLLSYELHAADLLDLHADAVDARMAVHPGMQRPLAQKLATLKLVFGKIAAARTVVTYSELLRCGSGEMPIGAAAHLAQTPGCDQGKAHARF
jgi:peptidoglycan/xylan/chitin deacetylase (PgdA/CDA1 family)